MKTKATDTKLNKETLEWVLEQTKEHGMNIYELRERIQDVIQECYDTVKIDPNDKKHEANEVVDIKPPVHAICEMRNSESGNLKLTTMTKELADKWGCKIVFTGTYTDCIKAYSKLEEALNIPAKPEWLDSYTMDKVKELWGKKSIGNSNPRLQAVNVVMRAAAAMGNHIGIKKANEMIEAYCR